MVEQSITLNTNQKMFINDLIVLSWAYAILQGVQLRFSSLAIVPPAGISLSPLLDLRLSVRVVSFPPLDVKF